MRRYWHNANDGKAVELACKRVNLAVLEEGFCVIRHPNIRTKERNLYRFEGTHLSDTGNEVYISTTYKGYWNIFYLRTQILTYFPRNYSKIRGGGGG